MAKRGVTVDFTANVARFTGAIDKATNDLGKFQTNAARTSKNINSSFDKLGRNIKSVFGGLVATLGVRELARMGDSFKNIQARLRLATSSAEDFGKANENLVRIAQSTKAPLESTSTLYTRIARSLLEVGGTQEQVAGVTESLALSLRLSGASAEESSSAMLQFSQAVASGVLRGEEFNAVNEAAPRAMQALANAIDVPTGALREMAKEGLITRDILVDAFTTQLPTLLKEAQELPETIGVAFQDLQNEALLAIGALDEMTSASASSANAISLIGSSAIKGFSAVATGINAVSAIILETGGLIASTFGALFSGQIDLIGDIRSVYRDRLNEISGDVSKVVDKLTAPIVLDVNIPDADEAALKRLQEFRKTLDGFAGAKSANNLAKRQDSFIQSIDLKANTLGKSQKEITLLKAATLELDVSQLQLVKSNAQLIESYGIFLEDIKEFNKEEENRNKIVREFIDLSQNEKEEVGLRLDRMKLEASLSEETSEIRQKLLAQFDEEIRLKKRILEIGSLDIPEEEKNRLEQQERANSQKRSQILDIQEIIDKQTEAANTSRKIWDNFLLSFQQTMGSSISRILHGDFNNILGAWKSLLLNMVAEAAAAQLGKVLFGGIGASLLSGIGSIFGSLGFGTSAGGGGAVVTGGGGIGFAEKGAVFSNNVAKFARGGIVDSLTPFKFNNGGTVSNGIMGEAGPEAIVPLQRDSRGRLGVSGGGRNITINDNRVIQIDSRSDRNAIIQDMKRVSDEGNVELVDRLERQGSLG